MIFLALLSSGCTSNLIRPKTLAEGDAGYTYIPMDPQSIEVLSFCKTEQNESQRDANLADLPDNAVRIGIQSTNTDGKMEFGIGSATGEKGIYKITVDYANTDTVSIPFIISCIGIQGEPVNFYRKKIPNNKHDESKFIAQRLFDVEDKYIQSRTLGSLGFNYLETDKQKILSDNQRIYHIPVFVGVGVRIVADVVTFKAGVNITGLGVIGGAASTNGLTGTMIAQTIGINGEKVAAAIPIQSTLDSTSVENALVAIGSVKTLLYDKETRKVPRVLGIYLPFAADKKLINSIVSEISRRPVPWVIGCARKTS